MSIRHVVVGSLLLVAFVGCAAQPAGSSAAANGDVTVLMTGTTGARFRAFYIADGNRSDISGGVPMTLKIHNISILAFAKEKAADDVEANASDGKGSMRFGIFSNDERAALLQLANGWSGTYVPASALAPASKNALIVIKPYWYEGTWVFDDAQTGLQREPFITGVPEMINTVVKDIPNAKSGFRLTASENPFPGSQHKLTWVRAESGGNFYRLDNPSLEGWLCPAMFRYFDHTPKTLYVKAEPVQ